MHGLPAGLAMDAQSVQWGTYGALLGMAVGPSSPGAPPPNTLATTWSSRGYDLRATTRCLGIPRCDSELKR